MMGHIDEILCRPVWSDGYPCYGGAYPDIMQGGYLPGDEPGYRCGSAHGEGCCPESCPHGEDFWESEHPEYEEEPWD